MPSFQTCLPPIKPEPSIFSGPAYVAKKKKARSKERDDRQGNPSGLGFCFKSLGQQRTDYYIQGTLFVLR